MRKKKRFEVYGVDTFEASSGGEGCSGKYTLAWFDDGGGSDA